MTVLGLQTNDGWPFCGLLCSRLMYFSRKWTQITRKLSAKWPMRNTLQEVTIQFWQGREPGWTPKHFFRYGKIVVTLFLEGAGSSPLNVLGAQSISTIPQVFRVGGQEKSSLRKIMFFFRAIWHTNTVWALRFRNPLYRVVLLKIKGNLLETRFGASDEARGVGPKTCAGLPLLMAGSLSMS